MSLLREIQASLMEQGQEIGPILLKLRFLASRLGSDPLAEWVRFESEGYPNDAELPDYRVLGVIYTVDTSGYGGSGMRNAPVPSALVKQHGGKDWVDYQCRQSVASIDNLVATSKNEGTLRIDASNLMLILQGKIYPSDVIISVTGSTSVAAMVEIQNAVRSRVLELTIELEKKAPISADITLGPISREVGTAETQKVSQITNQVIHGNYMEISNTGVISSWLMSIAPLDAASVVSALVEKGIPEAEAAEFSEILAEEEPDSAEEPFGPRAKSWIAEKTGKFASGAWKIGIASGTKVLTEAALKYYDLK
jgi:hypothetical protein